MSTYHGLDPHDDNKWEERARSLLEKNCLSGYKKIIVFNIFI